MTSNVCCITSTLNKETKMMRTMGMPRFISDWLINLLVWVEQDFVTCE